MNKFCVHAFVLGKVQGVWFRVATQEKARELGLGGWVKNLIDGRVEVLACGTPEKIELLLEWLWQGPPNAEVSQVVHSEAPWQAFTDFVIEK